MRIAILTESMDQDQFERMGIRSPHVLFKIKRDYQLVNLC